MEGGSAMIDSMEWKRGIKSGVVAGIVWGWLAVAANSVSGIFPFEHSIIYNLVASSIGGMLFGIVAGGFLTVTYRWIPLKGALPKAVFLTTSLWLLLRLGGFLLSLAEPDRFHQSILETLQGLVLVAVMGCVLGFVWKRQLGRLVTGKV